MALAPQGGKNRVKILTSRRQQTCDLKQNLWHPRWAVSELPVNTGGPTNWDTVVTSRRIFTPREVGEIQLSCLVTAAKKKKNQEQIRKIHFSQRQQALGVKPIVTVIS